MEARAHLHRAFAVNAWSQRARPASPSAIRRARGWLLWTATLALVGQSHAGLTNPSFEAPPQSPGAPNFVQNVGKFIDAADSGVDLGGEPERGANFHVMSNGIDVTYTGVGAGGSQVAGVDGIGVWISGEDMKGSTMTALGEFGYRQVAFRVSQSVIGSPGPGGPRMDFPAILVVEMDGRNAYEPDVFLLPGCTTTGVMGLTSAGDLPYGAPPGASASFLISNLPSGAGLPSVAAILIPNNGLVPSSNGGTATLIGALAGSIPIASTGFCWVVQFDWVSTALVSLDHIDGWWMWLTNSRDGNQYWCLSSDEMNTFQSQSVVLDAGASQLIAFFANVDYDFHSLTADPFTNDAMHPAGFNGSGTYYATSTASAGSSFNGGFDLGRHLGWSITGTGGALSSQTGLGNQDPAGSPTPGLVPSLGFVTWNNQTYLGPGGVVGGWRLTWIQYQWDMAFGLTPEMGIPALVFLGQVRVPLCIPASLPSPWPQPYPTMALWPLDIHDTTDQTGNHQWPDPNGFAGGTYGVRPIVGSSIHLPIAAIIAPSCLGVPVAWQFGSTGLLGAAGPLTWRPDVNRTSTAQLRVLID